MVISRNLFHGIVNDCFVSYDVENVFEKQLKLKDFWIFC